ncbi:MAG: hypothetical protein ACYSWZ_00775 [Planctomycetota bacterium]|jgi:hypothetical protein
MPDSEVFSQTSAFPRNRSPDEELTAENVPVKPSQDFTANSDESVNTSKTTSEELSSTSDVRFHAFSEKQFQKPLKKTSIDVDGLLVQPRIPELSEHIKRPPAPSQSDHEEVTSKSVDISPAVGRQSLDLRDVQKPIPGKLVEHSEALTSEFGWEKQTGPSISSEPQIGTQHDVSNKFQKSQPETSVIGSKFQVYQPALEMPPAEDKSPLSRKDDIRIVEVEPAVEAPRQAHIKELIKKTSSATVSSAAEKRDIKKIQTNKEVRVNIGRIEIKTSQQSSPSVKSSPRGFEDHAMMRVYLDRHYF